MDTDEKKHIIQKMEELLLAQKQHMKDYLKLLDNEKKAIEKEDIEKFSLYMKLERSTVEELLHYDKSILQFENTSSTLPPDGISRIEKYRTDIEELREQALALNKENRLLLKSHLESVKKEIINLKRKQTMNTSPYKKIGEPNFIDIIS